MREPRQALQVRVQSAGRGRTRGSPLVGLCASPPHHVGTTETAVCFVLVSTLPAPVQDLASPPGQPFLPRRHAVTETRPRLRMDSTVARAPTPSAAPPPAPAAGVSAPEAAARAAQGRWPWAPGGPACRGAAAAAVWTAAAASATTTTTTTTTCTTTPPFPAPWPHATVCVTGRRPPAAARRRRAWPPARPRGRPPPRPPRRLDCECPRGGDRRRPSVRPPPPPPPPPTVSATRTRGGAAAGCNLGLSPRSAWAACRPDRRRAAAAPAATAAAAAAAAAAASADARQTVPGARGGRPLHAGGVWVCARAVAVAAAAPAGPSACPPPRVFRATRRWGSAGAVGCRPA